MSTVTFENVCRAHTKRQVIIKMNKFRMFITAVFVLFLIMVLIIPNTGANTWGVDWVDFYPLLFRVKIQKFC